MASNSIVTLNKLVVLVLVGGFAMLVAEIRFEHVDVLREDWRGWIPIAYSALMVVLGLGGLAFWKRGGRQVLLFAFAVAFVIGGLGFWFHTHGQPLPSLTYVLSAWTQQLRHQDGPPALAPLSFAGLGMIGVLACLRRFQC
jgi:hypothetical protein